MSGQGRYLKNMEIANLVSNKNTICRICLELNTNLTSLFDHIDVNEIKRSLELLLLECTSIQVNIPLFLNKLFLYRIFRYQESTVIPRISAKSVVII